MGSLLAIVEGIFTPLGGAITVVVLVGLYFYLRWLLKD